MKEITLKKVFEKALEGLVGQNNVLVFFKSGEKVSGPLMKGTEGKIYARGYLIKVNNIKSISCEHGIKKLFLSI